MRKAILAHRVGMPTHTLPANRAGRLRGLRTAAGSPGTKAIVDLQPGRRLRQVGILLATPHIKPSGNPMKAREN